MFLSNFPNPILTHVISGDHCEIYIHNSDHLHLATQPVKTFIYSSIGFTSKFSQYEQILSLALITSNNSIVTVDLNF